MPRPRTVGRRAARRQGATDQQAAATTQDPTASDASAAGTTDADGQLVSNLAGVTLPHDKPPVPLLFFVVAGIALALVVFGPPIYGLRLSKKPEILSPDDAVKGEARP